MRRNLPAVALLVCGVLAVPPGAARADDCDDAKTEARVALRYMLKTKLELETAQFRKSSVLNWRDVHAIPDLLGDELAQASSQISAAAPQADLAETDYEEALFEVTSVCADGG